MNRTITASEYTELNRRIVVEQGGLNDLGTGALHYPLRDGRIVRVHTYTDADAKATATVGRTVIEKRAFASPAAEVEERVRALQQAQPGLTRD